MQLLHFYYTERRWRKEENYDEPTHVLTMMGDECPSIPATKLSGAPAALNLEANVPLKS
jgi:hypothetical protein